MSARRFFVEGVFRAGETTEIGGGDAHKIARVLRLRDGDRIEVIDSAGTQFAAALAFDDAIVRATLLEAIVPAQARVAALEVAVAQAVPKGQKMDFVVEKATELGAAEILPFYCERSVVRDVGEEKLERWRRLAKSAAQQCGRTAVPPIRTAHSFQALLARMREYESVLFAWELAPKVPLLERLPSLLAGVRCALVVIGPEGGFTHDEATAAQAAGAACVWLGPRILRTETAAMALLAVVDAFHAVQSGGDCPHG